MKKTFILLTAMVVSGLTLFAQNVGIGTKTPKAALHLYGDLVLEKGILSLAPTGGILNLYSNIDIAGNRFAYYDVVPPAGNCYISGFTGGTEGRMVTLYNNSTNTIWLQNQSTNSTAANRIHTGTGADVQINGYGTISLRYMAKDNLWHVVNSYNDYNSGIWQKNAGGDAVRYGKVGIGSGNDALANKLQIGIAPGFSGHDLAIGNGIQAMSFWQNSSASIWYSNTNFALLAISGATNVGIGTITPTNRLQIGNPPGFSGQDLAIGNGTQGMSFYQSPTASIFYTNTNFELLSTSGTTMLGIGREPRSTLDVSGGVRMPIKTVYQSTGSYTVADNDYTIVVDMQQASNDFTIKLPPVLNSEGRIIKILTKNIDLNNISAGVSVLYDNNNYVDGLFVLKYRRIAGEELDMPTAPVKTFQCDGLAWYVIDKNL